MNELFGGCCLIVVLHVWNSGGELVFSPKRARLA